MIPVLWIVLALVLALRVAELIYARRNTRLLLARGGVELGSAQYPFFVLLHGAWIVSMALLIAPATAPDWWMIGAYALLQPVRVWAIAALGPYWTTRVITLSGAPLIRSGPYRYLRHPNYAVVCAEIALLPLAFGAVGIAIVFSALNAALLAWRLRVENGALRERRA